MIRPHHLTPLTKGGTRTVHAGKGSKVAPMNAPFPVTGAAPGAGGMNNYAKATPMAAPQAGPTVPPGLGSGNWPGIGQ